MPNARWRARVWWTKGAHNGNYKHGLYTAEAIASRRWLRHQTREVRALAKRLRQL